MQAWKCFARASRKANPTVLIVTTGRWASTARLAIALAHAGFAVEALCPSDHLLAKTTAPRRVFAYQSLSPLPSLLDAIHASVPNLIVSSDDLATRHLHELYYRETRAGASGEEICRLIEDSLGSPEGYPIVDDRASFIELAQREGIRAPTTIVVANKGVLKDCISRLGLPIVLKANGTSSGEGVRIAQSLEEAERAFHFLQAPPQLLRVAKRAFVNRDMRSVRPALERRQSVVNAQEFVSGRDTTSLAACWKGKVLASLHFEVVEKQYSYGPASVLRWLENSEVSTAIDRIVRRLNLSGLHGFDFLLEDRTQNPYLIEMNSRATQVGHLTLGPGHDLPAELYAAVTGKVVREAAKLTDNSTVALFPQEWLRNPESTFLRSGYHDVPWEEPELVRACLRKTRRWSEWCSQNTWIRILNDGFAPASVAPHSKSDKNK